MSMAAAGPLQANQGTSKEGSRVSLCQNTSIQDFGSPSTPSFIDFINCESLLLKRFCLQFHFNAPQKKVLHPFSLGVIVLKCWRRKEFWKFCSDKIEKIHRFIALLPPSAGWKYLNDSGLIIFFQTASTDMYKLREVSRSPLSYLRFIKTCQYTWLTMAHLAMENSLGYSDSTKLKPFVFQALSFLREYFFSDVGAVRDALAPSLETVLAFVNKIVNSDTFDAVILEDHVIDLMKKCLIFNSSRTDSIFRILVVLDMLNKLATRNVLILDANGVTDRVIKLLEDVMEILTNGERSIYWIVTIDSIFIMASQYLNMVILSGVMICSVRRINEIVTTYLEHTFSENLFLKRSVNSVISLYINCLLGDNHLDFDMIFSSIDAVTMKHISYDNYFSGAYTCSYLNEKGGDDRILEEPEE